MRSVHEGTSASAEEEEGLDGPASLLDAPVVSGLACGVADLS